MENPSISVVISTYARPKYIERAIDSVLAQTYKALEIIVVDDNGEGAEDQLYTKNLLLKYSSAINYISYPQNRGANHARNVGVKAANGQWISFLDDDDYYYPNCLQERAKLIKEHKIEHALIFNNITINGKQKGNPYFEGKDAFFVMDGDDLYRHGNCIGGFSFFVVDKESLLSVGLLDESLPSFQDWDIFVRLVQKSVCFWGINQPLIDYTFLVQDVKYSQISTNKGKKAKGLKAFINKHSAHQLQLSKKDRVNFYKRICIHGTAYCPELVFSHSVKILKEEGSLSNFYFAVKIVSKSFFLQTKLGVEAKRLYHKFYS